MFSSQTIPLRILTKWVLAIAVSIPFYFREILIERISSDGKTDDAHKRID
jgi:hypothetical protein